MECTNQNAEAYDWHTTEDVVSGRRQAMIYPAWEVGSFIFSSRRTVPISHFTACTSPLRHLHLLCRHEATHGRSIGIDDGENGAEGRKRSLDAQFRVV